MLMFVCLDVIMCASVLEVAVGVSMRRAGM